MTLDEIKARVWERIEENSSTPLRYPASLLEEYVMDGERFYVARTGCLTTTQTVTQTANTLMYDLESDCIQVERVSWSNGGVYYPVTPTTPRDLDETWALQTRWITQTGTRATHYFIFGMNKIALFPLLSSGTNTYIVHYQRDIPATSLPAATMPVEDHELLVNYALSRCLLSERKVRDGMAEYGQYRAGVLAAARRMGSVDRVWAMSSGPSLGG